jgi:hypothetical protein
MKKICDRIIYEERKYRSFLVCSSSSIVDWREVDIETEFSVIWRVEERKRAGSEWEILKNKFDNKEIFIRGLRNNWTIPPFRKSSWWSTRGRQTFLASTALSPVNYSEINF